MDQVVMGVANMNRRGSLRKKRTVLMRLRGSLSIVLNLAVLGRAIRVASRAEKDPLRIHVEPNSSV